MSLQVPSHVHSQTHNSRRAPEAPQMNILAILITGPRDSAIPDKPPIIPGKLVPPSKSLAPPRANVLLCPPPIIFSIPLGSLMPAIPSIFVNAPPVINGMITNMNTFNGCRRM